MVDPEDIYSQVWQRLPPVQRDVQRYLEKAFERRHGPYELPTQTIQLRRAFRRFLRQELGPITGLIQRHKSKAGAVRPAREVPRPRPRRRGRVADPRTWHRRYGLFTFVAGRAVSVDALLHGKLTVIRGARRPYDALALEWRRLNPSSAFTPGSIRTTYCILRRDEYVTTAFLTTFQANFDRQYQLFKRSQPSDDDLYWLARVLTTEIPSPLQMNYETAIHLAVHAYALTRVPDGSRDARYLRTVGHYLLRLPLLYTPGLGKYPKWPKPRATGKEFRGPVTAVFLRRPDGTRVAIWQDESAAALPQT